ncbi:thiolase family protein [Anaerotruncus sp. 80]|uniref:Acetyl-CoA acetyltransferase n=1 Tax=Anaerotruncus colihominis TaxID=169435 RepID=A0A845QF38_9FIRM|nr:MULTISPECIES: thiolase family protein [Clostridia]MCI9639667.1 thiolase family protein [Emergencia sp.]NBH60170.1 thiolase family protein [Anaerotruncus colihominis]NCF00101.1 thiolase family protein [Emergencia sp. 1XD21-10]NCF00824.1 thiolase family protein [Anaerotruncus sp. 80]
MRNVVITAGCRTPIGALGGQFKTLTSLDLSIPVMQNLIERAGIDPVIIEDVIWGCNYQRTYKENNLARVAAVKAGLPVTVPGITIHRNCTSSMSSIQFGYYQIKAGEADCIMAGGADSMSTAPHMVFNARYGQKYGHMELRDSMWDSLTNLGVGPAMGITAENVADEYDVTREQMDAYALRSQQRAVAAIDAGKFQDEIIPITIKGKKGDTVINTDEYPRRDASLEKLAKLKPTFKEDGRVTAGNASGMNDAASGVILMAEDKARKLGVPILARIKAVATTGVRPEVMGIGPISASQKALEKAGLAVDDIDLFEINEAFAAQCLACQKTLGIPDEKLNVNGSGISLGHPVGATGSRLVITCMYELMKRKQKYGLATLCAGGGMGTAVIIEMV